MGMVINITNEEININKEEYKPMKLVYSGHYKHIIKHIVSNIL